MWLCCDPGVSLDPGVPFLHPIIAISDPLSFICGCRKQRDVPQIALQLIFMAFVADRYWFATIVSVLCSFFSLLFSIFSKRNLRDSMDEDEAEEAKVDHGDGVAAETELTVVVSGNAKEAPVLVA